MNNWGLNERDESTHKPSLHAPLENQPPGWYPSSPTKRRRTSEAALEGNNKERAESAQRRLNQAAASKVDPAISTATAGKVAIRTTHAPNLPL